VHPDEQIFYKPDISVMLSSVHIWHKIQKEIIFSEKIINLLVDFPHSFPQLKSI